MADEATTRYEDIINEMTLGIRFIYDEFGVRPTVGWSIDPFGHSKEVEALYSAMGFDAWGINRVHYADKEERTKNQKLEFVWRGSASQGAKSDMFIHMMDNHYCSPAECDFFSNSSGDCMYWKEDSNWFQDNAELPTFKVNAEAKAQAFVDMVKKRATYYDNGNNLLITWGCDFTFLSAPVAYDNMDKLIKYVNANEERFGVHVQYAVFSDYIKAVHQHKKQWDVYEGDFMPYATEDDSYWVGYYTSRGRLKGLSRRAMNELAAAELALTWLSKTSLPHHDAFVGVERLREAQGEFQHHDAITGTEKQAVANDYNVQLVDGLAAAHRAGETLLASLVNRPVAHNLTTVLTQQSAVIGVVTTNPTAHTQRSVVQLVLPSDKFNCVDEDDHTLPHQINEIPSWSSLRANGTHVMFIPVTVPALGVHTVFVERTAAASSRVGSVSADSFIENAHYRVTFEANAVKEILVKDRQTALPFAWTLSQYHGRFDQGNRNSGAYVFVPESNDPEAIAPQSLTVVKGELVEEARVVYRTGYQQILRVYKSRTQADAGVECSYEFGPTDDGAEIITRLSSPELKTDRVFFTDENGVEDVERRFIPDDVQPIPRNYYPITARLSLRVPEKDLRFNVNVDRAHGASSIHDGELEIMLRRRTMRDENLGVGEPLTENDVYIQTMWISVGAMDSMAVVQKEMEEIINHPVIPFFFASEKVEKSVELSMMKKDFPPNVELLTLQWMRETDKEYLLRVHHLYQKGDVAPMGENVTLDLNDYFAFPITEMKEYSLNGVIPKDVIEKERMVWNEKAPAAENEEEGAITLSPAEFRTFRVRF